VESLWYGDELTQNFLGMFTVLVSESVSVACIFPCFNIRNSYFDTGQNDGHVTGHHASHLRYKVGDS
jgi:hypothetical protein